KMLENARRLRKGIPGCPKVEMTSGLDFFKRLGERVKDNKHLPKWVSELYLEYHRGTYTTMGRSKRYNRKAEFLYHDLEVLAVISDVATAKHEYPKEALRKGWKVILLNQFHDIIPGTSIEEVYEESYAQYEELLEEGKKTQNKLLDVIACNIQSKGLSVMAMNTLGHKRNDLVYVDLEELPNHAYAVLYEGERYPLQRLDGGIGIFYGRNMPGSGYRTYTLVEEEGKRENQLIVKKDHLENPFFVLKLNEKGQITSIYDKKAQREIIHTEKPANVFQAFEDKPHKWDAWDINIYYQEKMWEIDELEEIEVVAVGPVRGTLKIRYRYMDSIILQYIHIYQDMDRIDFETEIDWKETHTLLKVAFPVDVHTNKATYDIQYGNVERPTHWNTSWDVARFEVCGHKWADLSEEGYGISLLNDCKYGYDIKDSVMRLSLLKSSTWPHPTADKEKHLFTYAIYPHMGNVKQGNTIEMGYQLNVPAIGKLIPPQEGNLTEDYSLVELDQRNVFIESIKEAEDDDAMILRLYEAMHQRGFVTMRLNVNVDKVFLCNLLEENIEEVQVNNHILTFEIKPYEIKTFKVYKSKR
ncbi:MAG: alpha-mannosidase, partial [Clostridia bacterium]|nr:alpha-mannosidase [Clostridia bacterium]